MLGAASEKQGHLDEAKQEYMQAYTIRQSLIEIDKTNLMWSKDLALSLDKLGDMDPVNAMTYYTEAFNRLESFGWHDLAKVVAEKMRRLQTANDSAASK
jgi:hypothetical protein